MKVREEPLHPVLARRPRRYPLFPLYAFAGAAALAFGFVAANTLPPLPSVASPDAGAAGVSAEAPGLSVSKPLRLRNSVSRQAAEWGLGACLGQIAGISDLLTASGPYSALSRRGGNDADSGIFSAVVSSRDPDGFRTLSTLSATPVPGGCNSAYQTVTAFPLDCQETRVGYFPGFAEQIEFGEAVSVYRSAGGAFIYLLALEGAGCAAIKAEIVH